MPRSSKSTAHTTPRPAATTTTSDSSVTSTDKRVWDTSPNTFPVHLLWLRRWLPKQHRFYRQLVLDGTFSEKGTTYCVSDNHIDRIIFKKLPVGTFTRPCLVAPTDHDETGFPSLSTEQQAAHSERRKSFRIWEAGVASWWETMADHITETIGDQGTADDLTTNSGNHGGVILEMWETKRAKLAANGTSNYGEIIIGDINSLESNGLADATVPALNSFYTDLTDLVSTLPDDMISGFPESVVARKLVTAAKRLGPLIGTKVDNMMLHDSSFGKLRQTRDTLNEVLGNLEATDLHDARANGLANRVRTDARRTDRQPGRPPSAPAPGNADQPWTTRAWSAACDEICNHCTFLKKAESEAKHWRKDCPHRDEALTAKKGARENKGKNGKGMHVRHDGSDDSGDDDDASDDDGLDCDDCAEDDSEEGSQFVGAFFSKGTRSLLDAAKIDDHTTLLATIKSSTSSDGSWVHPGKNRSLSTRAGPSVAFATETASKSIPTGNGKANMLRSGRSPARDATPPPTDRPPKPPPSPP